MFTFHLTPFTHCWKPYDDDEAIDNLYSEAYASEAMREAHEAIRSLPQAPNDNLEHIVAPLMLWSDSTHLAAFGTASVWPFYLAFGNQSKSHYMCSVQLHKQSPAQQSQAFFLIMKAQSIGPGQGIS